MSARRKAGRDPMESMPVHVADWLTSETVALLGLIGEAIYMRLLMAQWKNEEDGLPRDEASLQKIVGAGRKHWLSCWRILESQFPVDPDGRRRNVRLGAERAYMLSRRELRRAAGQLGGVATQAAKGKQTGSNATRLPVANGKQNASPSPSPSPTTSVEVVGAATPPATDGTADLSARFADARHREAYQRARRSHRVPMALDATLEAMAEGMAGPGGKPCTWHQLGVAILEAQAAQRDLTAQTLRNFAAKAPAAPEAASTPATDAPGTIRDTAGRLVWHPGQADARPSDDEITGNGWRVAA